MSELPPSHREPLGLRELDASYTRVWSSFADGLRAHTDLVRTWASETEDDLHPVLRAAQWTPKNYLQKATRVGGRKPNVGSAPGLFFEHLAAVAIGARLQRLVTGTSLHRNHPGAVVRVSTVPKQPDLLVYTASTDRTVVFEFKTSPNSGNVEDVRAQRGRWEESPGVQFFLVGGHANIGVAADLASEAWATVLRIGPDGRDTVGSTVDDLVRAAARHLLAV